MRHQANSTIQEGDSGSVVQALQGALQQLGYMHDYQVDSVFGPQTRASVEKFQGDHGLSVDGIVGYNTWSKIADELGV